ncbi:MAG: flagellar M-ring protein FliF [Treponema sp.]|nr:flagellar M-ring protein FliF [Treponema sp.]
MNEWLKKVFGKIKDLWSKGKPIQKVIIIAIAILIIVAVVLTASLSSKPSTVKVYTSAITNEEQLQKITDRIDEENIKIYVSNGIISVDDEKTARKVRAILASENIAAPNPFEDYYQRDWSTTDSDQLVKLNKALQEELRQYILTVDGIRDASVIIVRPETTLFSADQKPVTAAVKIRTDSNSDILTNRRKIQGLQRLILAGVEGLTEENLVITDWEGNQLNDFSGMAESDRIDLIAKQQKLINRLEIQYTASILESLQNIFTTDRIRNLNVKIDMDMSERKINSTEYSPITIKVDNPDTPYDDSEFRDTLPISSQTVTKEWQGTGYNPEGPAGVEGQTPPTYSDMSNVIGKSTETGVTQNNVINTKETSEIYSPNIDKIAVSVNVDGVTRKIRDPETGRYVIEDGSIKREYIAPTQEELDSVKRIIQGAIGYNRSRGDLVEVTAIKIDRFAEQEAEDAEYWAAVQRRRTILLVLIAIVVVLVGFILFRIISKEVERRRREKEARLLAEQQAARERALWEAKDEGMEVTMSVEETRRMELQENAVNMAKEHPEDVAMLIRTWLMEE